MFSDRISDEFFELRASCWYPLFYRMRKIKLSAGGDVNEKGTVLFDSKSSRSLYLDHFQFKNLWRSLHAQSCREILLYQHIIHYRLVFFIILKKYYHFILISEVRDFRLIRCFMSLGRQLFDICGRIFIIFSGKLSYLFLNFAKAYTYC